MSQLCHRKRTERVKSDNDGIGVSKPGQLARGISAVYPHSAGV
jgi:hypothetical protein